MNEYIPLKNNQSFNDVKTNMTKWYVVLMISSLPCFGSGQVGLNLKALLGQSKSLDTVSISQNGFQVSFEYHFRLKKKRVEFRPGLGYRLTWNGSNVDGYFKSFDFDLNTAIYPFDFRNDCHCPTFSQNGELLRKGFFIEINPGIAYQTLTRLKSDPVFPVELPIESKKFVLKIGGTVGLDLGISERLTITPMLSATYLIPTELEGLRHDGSIGRLKDYIYLGAGVRATLHPDPKRRRRH